MANPAANATASPIRDAGLSIRDAGLSLVADSKTWGQGPPDPHAPGPPPWAVQLQQQMQQLQQQMQQMQQQMQQGQQQGQQQMQQMQQVQAPFLIAAARAYNATVPFGRAPYVAPPTAAGVVPAGMPANGSALRALTGANVNAALQAYGLPTVGTVPERKNRLALHWGIVNVQF